MKTNLKTMQQKTHNSDHTEEMTQMILRNTICKSTLKSASFISIVSLMLIVTMLITLTFGPIHHAIAEGELMHVKVNFQDTSNPIPTCEHPLPGDYKVEGWHGYGLRDNGYTYGWTPSGSANFYMTNVAANGAAGVSDARFMSCVRPRNSEVIWKIQMQPNRNYEVILG